MTINHDPGWWFAIGRDAVGLVLAAGTGITLWLRKRSATVWPVAFGRVESVSSYEENFVWRTDVSYSYSVGPNFYSGQFQVQSYGERRANQKELRWRGQSIRIRYSPKDANISVVRAEDQAGLLQ